MSVNMTVRWTLGPIAATGSVEARTSSSGIDSRIRLMLAFACCHRRMTNGMRIGARMFRGNRRSNSMALTIRVPVGVGSYVSRSLAHLSGRADMDAVMARKGSHSVNEP